MTVLTPGYSFVIPCYEDRDGIARHLAYFARHAEPAQLIVVDDCSLDDTAAIVADAKLPDCIELIYLRRPQNSGPAAARNLGAALADREYMMFLDADDLLTENFFSIMHYASFTPGVDLVMFKYHLSVRPDQRYSYNMHQVDRTFFSRGPSAPYPNQQFSLTDRPGVLATVNYPWNKIYRRRFYEDAKISFPDLRMHEDITPHWQSFLRCERFGVLDWAPPLLTHYEIPKSGRATQYIGEKRLSVFPELLRVEAELLHHPDTAHLQPTFAEFCAQLFDWMTGPLCDMSAPDGRYWRSQYAAEIDKFWELATTSPLLPETERNPI